MEHKGFKVFTANKKKKNITLLHCVRCVFLVFLVLQNYF